MTDREKEIMESTSSNVSEASTTPTSHTYRKRTKVEEAHYKVAEELEQVKAQLAKETNSKRKLYSSLVKLAQELKRTRADYKNLVSMTSNTDDLYQQDHQQQDQQQRQLSPQELYPQQLQPQNCPPWYEGGAFFRRPELLPDVQNNIVGNSSQYATNGQNPVSLSELFFDMVIITSFSRVGIAIQDRGHVDKPSLVYFAIFWLIWIKEASYSTRFDTTDLTAQLINLCTCFVVLFGSLSTTSPFGEDGALRMMGVAAFVAWSHFFLHLRVFYSFKDIAPHSSFIAVKDYALLVMILTCLEGLTWIVGIFILPVNSPHQNVLFAIGILFSLRIPRTFLPNDFHAACSKRGVLFILLLGFLLQSMLMVASPFFDYQSPTWEQYLFVGLVCFLLFCIKLLYVDDTFAVDPQDHALLVNRWAGFFFQNGQFTLLLSTTVLGGGLNLLTHSYLAATSSLPDNAKFLVCGGFSGVILSIAFIKSLHLRRIPLNPSHRLLFFVAYGIQVFVLLGIAGTTMSMALIRNGFFGFKLDEIQLLGVLSGMALLLWIISLLDEAVEWNIYGGCDAREFRIHPFGLWWCLKPGEPEPPLIPDISDRRLDHLAPFVNSSRGNLFDSQRNVLYGSLGLSHRENNGRDEGAISDDESKLGDLLSP